MRVDIEIQNAVRGKFSDIKLCYTDRGGNLRKVPLRIEFAELYHFSRDKSSASFDFFLISSIVYGIDNLLERYQYSVDAWAREIEVCFPVNESNLTLWRNSTTRLQNTLSFLTGDYWSVSFSALTVNSLFEERVDNAVPDKTPYQAISLFSGGLDSLIGVIDQLEDLEEGKKIILASHFDPSSPGANSDQERLEKYLSLNYRNKLTWIQACISLNSVDSDGNEFKKEPSFRSRSILFIAIGAYLLSPVPVNTLLIPENGTISLNYPLTPSRSSSLSTRTTHPHYLNQLQELLTNLNLNIRLDNPYALKTKGEMVVECKNRSILQGIYPISVSCGKRGRKQNWSVKSGTSHCGVCMPCIYRRAALHKLNWDTQTYGNDLLTSADPEHYTDMPALFDYLKTALSLEKIERGLVVNGSIPIEKLKSYAAVVDRSRMEILKWIKDKGSNQLKTILGIR